MTDTVWIAVIVAVPPCITAIGAIIHNIHADRNTYAAITRIDDLKKEIVDLKEKALHK